MSESEAPSSRGRLRCPCQGGPPAQTGGPSLPRQARGSSPRPAPRRRDNEPFEYRHTTTPRSQYFSTMSHATDDVVASILNELKEAGVTTPGEAAGYFKREKIMRKSQKGAGAAAGAQDEDEDELEAFRQELADAAMGSGGQEKAAERRAEPSSPSDESSEDEDAADEVAAFKASLTGESPEVYREREDASTAAPGGEGEFSDTAKAGFEKALISGGQTPPEEHRRKEAAREDMTVEEQKQALLGVSDAAKSEPTTDHAEDDDLDKIFKEFLAGAAREAN